MREQIQTRLVFGILLGLLLAAGQGKAQFPTQRPAGYVNDLAGVLSPAARQELEALCTELDQKTRAQLAIVTVRSLEGRPLEEFTIDLATQWGIGPKGSDRGVLLFLAIDDRRTRIEVGYGLEPIIPDGQAGGILRDMTPHLQSGDYDGAMRLAASTIAQIVAQDSRVALSPQRAIVPPVTRVTFPPPEPVWLRGLYTFLGFTMIAAVIAMLVLWEWYIAICIVIALLLEPRVPRSLSDFGQVIGLSALAFFLVRRGWKRKIWRRLSFSREDGGWSIFGGGGSGGWSGGGGGFGGFGGGGFGGGGASGGW